MRARREEKGMTLLETLMAASLMSVVVGAVAVAVVPMLRSESVVSVDMRLYSDGRRALQQIASDLRQATNSTVEIPPGGGIFFSYPEIFTPYDPVGGTQWSADYPAFNTITPTGALWPTHGDPQAGDPDYGATTQIVFRVPTDIDGNGTATDQATGLIEWGNGVPAGWDNDMTYCLVLNPATNLNELRRYTDYGANIYRTVAVNVERVLFERNDGSGGAWDSGGLAAGGSEIRATLWLRAPDGSGGAVRARVSTTVNVRN